jgi:isopenicillin N synthase-like dioxygenase
MSDGPNSATSQVNLADLEVLSLCKLRTGNVEEVQRLLQASSSPGMFFLDLRDDPDGVLLLHDLPEVYALAKKYFGQPENTKSNDIRLDQQPTQDRGYKQSDCDETFEMSYDELRKPDFELPPILQQRVDLVNLFSERCHSACLAMLSCLSTALGKRFEQFHRQDAPSDSGLKLIYEPCKEKTADVVDNLHTDSGTLTFLFYDKLGLEVELVDQNTWAFTPVLEGCALINVANSLQRLSGNVLHSPRHRVTQVSDGFAERYYISYFLRPGQLPK